jgi:hypothetical protein
VANPPSGAGHLWRISEAGFSRDPAVRLSVAAQALQRDDGSFFAGEKSIKDDEPVVWKNRGRVRLPLLPSRPRSRPSPLHGFRSVLRELAGHEAARALAMVEDSARGLAEGFEARALWPRILSRLFAADVPIPAHDPDVPLPAVQLVEGEDPAAAQAAFREWSEAAEALRALLGDRGAWLPRVLPPRHVATLLEAERPRASILLVHGAPPSPRSLLGARQLAASKAVRGAAFLDHLDRGRSYEVLPDLPAPQDPRYREEVWLRSGAAALHLGDLARSVDEATAQGRLTTPVSHLLSLTAVGMEECHAPPARAPSPRAGPG